MRAAIHLSLAFVLIPSLAPAASAAEFCAATGHYYDFVATSCSYPWTNARDDAAAMGGYLATVTSAAEQECMKLAQGGGWSAYWAGGSDAAAEGVWRWMTGPEAGTQFWQGGFGGGSTFPDFYANWFGGEPNNSGNEDYMSWNAGGCTPDFSSCINNFWNDVPVTNSAVCGFTIEYDSNPDAVDSDGDGVSDDVDNCPDDENPLQEDNDNDGLGDVCDPDDDNDGVDDLSDNCPVDGNPLQEDFDVDGLGNVCDPTFSGGAIIGEIEVLVLLMRDAIVSVDPPGGNGMIAKLTGKGGLLAKVGSAVSAFENSLIDVETYLFQLQDALEKLGAFDNQLAAKTRTGKVPDPEASQLAADSAAIRAIIDSLISAVGG